MKPSSIGGPGAFQRPQNGSTQTPARATSGSHRAGRVTAGGRYLRPLGWIAMLGFEREVVSALLTVTEPDVRGRVEAWVEGSLATMPDFVRFGIAVQSVVFG